MSRILDAMKRAERELALESGSARALRYVEASGASSFRPEEAAAKTTEESAGASPASDPVETPVALAKQVIDVSAESVSLKFEALNEIPAPSPAATQAQPASELIPIEDRAALSCAAASEDEPLTFEWLKDGCAAPSWNPDPKKMLFFESDSHATGAEELRALRSRLYQWRETHAIKTVLVASALRGEGRTFIAANLAQAMVRQHKRVALVIDADLRAPRMAQAFGAPACPGLTDYLSGKADEFQVIQRAPMENLFFLPAGTAAQNPTELLANGRLKKLLERLSPLFDWIILDSPPAFPLSDARILSAMCDAVLVVVRAGATEFTLAKRACDVFSLRSCVGVVLNGVPASRFPAPHRAALQTAFSAHNISAA